MSAITLWKVNIFLISKKLYGHVFLLYGIAHVSIIFCSGIPLVWAFSAKGVYNLITKKQIFQQIWYGSLKVSRSYSVTS